MSYGWAKDAEALARAGVPDPFKRVVLEWLKQRDSSAIEVLAVSSHGTDYAGSTEGGFYSTFEVDLRYRTDDGRLIFMDVEGDDMESLWSWVVGHVVVTDSTDQAST